jgi:DNA-binding response OmpR family regulator
MQPMTRTPRRVRAAQLKEVAERRTPMTVSESRILVVDDQRNIRSNLKMILEDAGYRVDATGDSEEALARCHRSRYDIAFADINIPRIGLDLVRCIRVLSKKTALVMLSRYGTLTQVVEAMKLGVIDFIEKPFHPRKIEPLCNEILQRRALMTHETVDELLHLAELALEHNAHLEARVYLKLAMLRDESRAEPYYWLSELCEAQGEIREALHYYCRALDVGPTFQPARKALGRLKQLATGTGA